MLDAGTPGAGGRGEGAGSERQGALPAPPPPPPRCPSSGDPPATSCCCRLGRILRAALGDPRGPARPCSLRCSAAPPSQAGPRRPSFTSVAGPSSSCLRAFARAAGPARTLFHAHQASLLRARSPFIQRGTQTKLSQRSLPLSPSLPGSHPQSAPHFSLTKRFLPYQNNPQRTVIITGRGTPGSQARAGASSIRLFTAPHASRPSEAGLAAGRGVD